MRSVSRAALLAAALTIPALASASPITLGEAVAKAIEAAPSTQAAEAAIAAARAGRTQAAVRPNPTLTVEGENIAGTGPYDAFRQSEVTATYSQVIERGGKRAARTGLADREIGVAEAAARVVRLDLAAEVERAFIDTGIAREATRIAGDRLTIEQEIAREAVRRVRGYKDPLFVETRAAARVAQARIESEQSQAWLAAARSRLAAFWGSDSASVEVVLDTVAPAGTGRLAVADDALAEAETGRARAAVTLEQTRRTQDYTVSGGARYLRGSDSVALVAGVTMPLARFDRNRGGIERAEAERRRAELTAEAGRLARLRRLAALSSDAEAASARADAIVREVWPRATKALAQVREGYARGGFAFRDVQDAADALAGVRADWLAATARAAELQIDIDRLTGRFDAVQPAETR